MRKAPDGQQIDPSVVEREIARIDAVIDGFAAAMKAAMTRKAHEGRAGWDDPCPARRDRYRHDCPTQFAPTRRLGKRFTLQTLR